MANGQATNTLTIVSMPLTVVTNSLMTIVTPPEVVVAFPSGPIEVTERSVKISEGTETVEEDGLEVGPELFDVEVVHGA